MAAKNPWQTREARKLRARVLREEPTCRLRLPGCTGVSTTVDHIQPQSQQCDQQQHSRTSRNTLQHNDIHNDKMRESCYAARA